MKRRIGLLLWAFAFAGNLAVGQVDSIQVYIFLGEECVISQYYTLPLKTLYKEYGDKGIGFTGLFPNLGSNEESRQAFREKYQLPFTLLQDTAQAWMQQFGVRVTPEVVVYVPGSGEVLYQGRIDDTYFRVGRRRPVTRNHELEDALKAIVQGEEIPVNRTDAVGCIITRLGEKNHMHTH